MAWFEYQQAGVDYRIEGLTYQVQYLVVLRGSSLSEDRLMAVSKLIPDSETLHQRVQTITPQTLWPLPSVLPYRIPYAKTPRSQIQWKPASAPVVGYHGLY